MITSKIRNKMGEEGGGGGVHLEGLMITVFHFLSPIA